MPISCTKDRLKSLTSAKGKLQGNLQTSSRRLKYFAQQIDAAGEAEKYKSKIGKLCFRLIFSNKTGSSLPFRVLR